MRRPFARLALSASLFALAASPAFALDAKAFADRMVELYANQGGVMSYGSAEASGADITVKGFAIDMAETEPLALGDVVFSNVTEENGTWRADTVTFADVNTTSEGATIMLTGLSMSGLVLPSDPATPFILYDRAEMKDLAVKVGGADVFTARNYVVEVQAPDPAAKVAFTSAAESLAFTVPATDPKSVERVTALFGSPTVAGRMVMNGSWEAGNGRILLDEFSLAVPSAGKLSFAFGLDGYTMQFMKTLSDVSKAAAAGGNDQNAQAAQGMAMLGLMQQLAFVSTTIRYEDEGLASKVLDEMAKERGMDRASMVMQTKAIVPFGLAQLQKPEFAASVTKAVSDFLDNPKNFTIKAAPDAPVPGALLMATGMSAPQDLVDQLKVTVTANE
ncbi:MAG: hypothetical protein MUC58_06300 [Rhizobiaceae bacterium]|jgi:hypothetical protein|nr:hypothetical protein [Rhizobiaceae bacterium]